jgi:signal transduction histidine kinase
MRDRVAQVQEHERAHVARELHDNVGQRMALLGVRLAELQQKTQKSDPSVAGQIVALQKLTNDICSDIHALSRRLHPSHVQYLGLTRALSVLCREFGDHHDMDVEFAHDEIADTVPFDVTICLYRVAQEALRNAQTHSGCRQVRVELASPRGAVCLRVSDPGRGFDPAARKPGHGLGFVSIAERLRILSGHWSVQSAPGQGTCIEVTIPLAADAARELPELAAVPSLPSMK